MKVVITGGGGFLGKKLARRILQQGSIAGADGKPMKVAELLLFDVARATGPGLDDPRVKSVEGDIANFATVRDIVQGASTVFHFAAVVSAGAEADFDLGYRVNLDGTRNMLEACRALGTNPRVVFTSSLAAYGGDLPPAVTDDTPLTPQTSYGSQKSIGEFLLRDYTRKGYLRGTAVRLPTICVRTGLPNKAASTWASSVVREPLTGVDVVCPVTPQTVMVVLSPRKTVDAFMRLHDLPVDAFGPGRTLLLNGIKVTARTSSRRWRPMPATAASARSCGSTIRRSRRSATAGPRASPRPARASSASRSIAISMRSCATSSPTISTSR